MPKTNYQADAVLTAIPAVWVGFVNGSSDTQLKAGTYNEISHVGYARKPVTLSESASGAPRSNTSEVIMETIPAGGSTFDRVCLFDAVSGGNLLYYTENAVSTSLSQGDIPTFPVGAITVTEL